VQTRNSARTFSALFSPNCRVASSGRPWYPLGAFLIQGTRYLAGFATRLVTLAAVRRENR